MEGEVTPRGRDLGAGGVGAGVGGVTGGCGRKRMQQAPGEGLVEGGPLGDTRP